MSHDDDTPRPARGGAVTVKTGILTAAGRLGRAGPIDFPAGRFYEEVAAPVRGANARFGGAVAGTLTRAANTRPVSVPFRSTKMTS